MRNQWFQQLQSIFPEVDEIAACGAIESPLPVMFVDEAVIDGKVDYADKNGRPDMGKGTDEVFVILSRPATVEERAQGSRRTVEQMLRIDNDQLVVSLA